MPTHARSRRVFRVEATHGDVARTRTRHRRGQDQNENTSRRAERITQHKRWRAWKTIDNKWKAAYLRPRWSYAAARILPLAPTTPAFGMRVLRKSEMGTLYWGTVVNHGTKRRDVSHPGGRWKVVTDAGEMGRFADRDQGVFLTLDTNSKALKTFQENRKMANQERQDRLSKAETEPDELDPF